MSIYLRPHAPIRQRSWGVESRVRGVRDGYLNPRLNPARDHQFEGGCGFDHPNAHDWSQWTDAEDPEPASFEMKRIGFTWQR